MPKKEVLLLNKQSFHNFHSKAFHNFGRPKILYADKSENLAAILHNATNYVKIFKPNLLSLILVLLTSRSDL